MESINNTNNINIELTKKHQIQHRIRKVLKKSFRAIHNMLNSKKIVIELIDNIEVDDNNFNEMLERRMEDQQNLMIEQIIGQQAGGYYFVESDYGKFYWSTEVSKFIACSGDEAKFDTKQQRAEIQCCWEFLPSSETEKNFPFCDNRINMCVISNRACDVQMSFKLTCVAKLRSLVREKILVLTFVSSILSI